MPMVNPLVQGGAVGGGSGGGGYAPPAESPAQAAPSVRSASRGEGFTMGNLGGGFTHPDNTSAHVGCAVALALGVVILFKVAGFRFSVDAGVAGG